MGFGWEMDEKSCVKGLSDQGKDDNRKNSSDLSEKSRQTAKNQLENDSAQIVRKHHKYFTDFSDTQTITIVSRDFEALLIKFRLVETPG
jgi:hypothetical protein